MDVQYPLPISTKYLREIQTTDSNAKPVVIDASRLGDPDYDVAQAVEEAASSTVEDTKMVVEEMVSKRTGEANGAAAAAKDTPDVPMRFSEKKRLNWKGKSYLAPLTTVGNLVCDLLQSDAFCWCLPDTNELRSLSVAYA